MTDVLDTLYAVRDQRKVEEERESLAMSLSAFVQAAWHVLKPREEYSHNWHIDAICEHLEAVTRGEILRLQIWQPRASMKSYNASIMWPAWEWTRNPGMMYWTASYALGLSTSLASKSRDLMLDPWYRDRWGDVFTLTKVGEQTQENDKGGSRLATAPGSMALGKHGHRILIDDAINAKAADATSRIILTEANEWYDSTVLGSLASPETSAIVNIQQRLHENDLAGHILETSDEEWVVLCLPERFETDHPYAWRGERVHPAVLKELENTPLYKGDPRDEGDLLWPKHRGEKKSSELAKSLTSFRAAGQLQQRPAAREGEILKRDWWRFYDPRFRSDPAKLPRFSMIVLSVDTPFKDKESNDLVAIQCYGIVGADRYLLDLDKGQMNYSKAKRRVKEMAQWARRLWPRIGHYCLIENAGYGVELIVDLKREITGVQKVSVGAQGDKVMRAEAASADLESGNIFVPGYGPPWQPVYEEGRSPADVAEFISSCALFPNALHDDDVDAWSMAMNWLRGKSTQPLRTTSALRRIVGSRQ